MLNGLWGRDASLFYRMWGGSIAIEEIEKGLMEIRKRGRH